MNKHKNKGNQDNHETKNDYTAVNRGHYRKKSKTRINGMKIRFLRKKDRG